MTARPTFSDVFLAATTPGPWTRHANCRGVDPQLFFPERGASLAEAKAVCADCKVRAECLEYGIDQHFGIWGGLSERERRQLRRQRRRVA